MNICFFTTDAPNLRNGGSNNVTTRLINALITKGHNLSCVSFEKNDNSLKGCSFFQLESDDYSLLKKFIQEKEIDIIVNPSSEFKWVEVIKHLKEDFENIKFIKVLHTTPLHAIRGVIDNEPLYTYSNKVSRFIYNISPQKAVRKYRRKSYLKETYLQWLEVYDKIVLLSAYAIPEFNNIVNIQNHPKVTAISNPINFYASNNDNDEKEKIVLFVGRIHRQAKRPDRLLAVWKKIYKCFPDWKLIFVGDGPMLESLKQSCQRHDLNNVEFVGLTDPNPYYEKASVLAVTSTYEGLPLAIAEAKSFGVVPIAFDSFSALSELVEDEVTGIKVRPFSINQYSQKMAKLMANEEYLENIRANIKSDTQFRAKFDMSYIISRWEALFNELMLDNG